MVLSEEIKHSLQLLNNKHAIPDETYKQLLEASIKELLHSENTSLKSINSNKPDVIKEIFAVLMQAFLTFARNNVQIDKVLSMLSELKVEASRAKAFAKIYETNKTSLQFKLGLYGIHAPHIVDVDWNIDYSIKSSVLDDSKGPFFTVKFIVDHPTEQPIVQFRCTVHELQDLVGKLKEAVLHCTKIAQ